MMMLVLLVDIQYIERIDYCSWTRQKSITMMGEEEKHLLVTGPVYGSSIVIPIQSTCCFIINFMQCNNIKWWAQKTTCNLP
jgi:hypothetical protein